MQSQLYTPVNEEESVVPDSSRDEGKIISVDAELTASSKFIPNKAGHRFMGKSPSIENTRDTISTVKRNNFMVKSQEEIEDGET